MFVDVEWGRNVNSAGIGNIPRTRITVLPLIRVNLESKTKEEKDLL